MAQNQTDTAELEAPASAETGKFSRDQIRQAILDAPGEAEIIDVFGIKVEVRAPSLEDLLQYRNASPDDETIMARAIINNVYVPGTDDHVFDNADIPQLMKKRFSKDMRKLNATVTRVLGGDDQILQEVDNESKSPKA